MQEKNTLINPKNPVNSVKDGSISFKNVSFKYYKNSEESILEDINLVIEEGKTTGIIGSTGCGKTTLVSLIPRFYDTDSGSVLIDGINVKDYSLEKLREENVEVVTEVSVSSKGIKTFFFRDPEGNIFHLIYRPEAL